MKSGIVATANRAGKVAAPAATAGIFGQSLADKTSSSTTSPEQWGADLVIPGYDGETGCKIVPILTGNRASPETTNIAFSIEISLDGGATFNPTADVGLSSRQTSVSVDDFHPLCVFSYLSGDVTGDIVVRAMRTDSTVGSQDTVRGYLSALVVPASSAVKVAHTAVTGKTSFAGTTVEDWGTETATLSGLTGVEYDIVALGTGICQGPTDTSGYSDFVAVATDGSTYTSSPRNRFRRQAGGGQSTDRYHLPVMRYVRATPTGDVKAKLQAQSAAVAAADMVSGRVVLIAVPTASSELKIGFATLTAIAQGSVPTDPAQWGTEEATIAGLSTPHNFFGLTLGERNGYDGVYVSMQTELSIDNGSTWEAPPANPVRTRIIGTNNASNAGALVGAATWANLTPTATVQARGIIDSSTPVGANTGASQGQVLIMAAPA